MKTIILISCLFILSSCWLNEGPAEFPAGIVMGYKPFYSEELNGQISFEANLPLENPGKIYVYKDYLLVSELFRGVHIYDNSNPSEPVKIGFINIAGCVDIGIVENRLVANYQNDLITIDISDINNPTEIDRVADVFNSHEILPPQGGGYFECVDPSRKHLIIGWEFTQLNNPECFR